MLHFTERRPGDVNIDQAEGLAGPGPSANALFVVGFPLQNNPAANKQIASTIPAITSKDVMIASRRAALIALAIATAGCNSR